MVIDIDLTTIGTSWDNSLFEIIKTSFLVDFRQYLAGEANELWELFCVTEEVGRRMFGFRLESMLCYSQNLFLYDATMLRLAPRFLHAVSGMTRET